jgi:4,5-dihydroxyphthalate decarboxylase
MPLTLRVAIGDYPHTLPLKQGKVVSSLLQLDFVEVKPLHKAFKAMVRDEAFDVSELALATFLQARAYNKDFALQPLAMLGRFQHHCMLYNSERGVLTPSDLAGKTIGVRSYSQTTGAWLRGILQNDYGVDFSGVKWITFEDGHVAECADPPSAMRAPAGKDMTQMLLDGELDAAIYGAAMPDDPRLKSVVANPKEEAKRWYEKHGVAPVNHMVVVKGEIARGRPDVVAELARMFTEAKQIAGLPKAGEVDTVPFGIEANAPCLTLLTRYALQQGLIPRAFSVPELFAVPGK